MITVDQDFLMQAMRKQSQGRGLKNSELSAIRHFERARIFPTRYSTPAARIRESDTRTSLDSGRDTLRKEPRAISTGGGGGGGYTEGASVSVPGSTGTLRGVVSHSGGHPGGYPTVVKMVDGNKSITLDSTGIVMTDTSTGKSFTIAFAALTQNVALRTEGYCDSTTSKSMLLPGSAPF